MANKLKSARFIECKLDKEPQAFTFLNTLREKEVNIMRLSSSSKRITFFIFEKDLPLLRKVRQQHRVTIHISRPDSSRIIQFHSFVLIGLLLFILIPFISSHFVWHVVVKDPSDERKAGIEKDLKALHVKEWVFKNRVPNDGVIRQKLLSSNYDLSWIHITRSGSVIKLEAVPAPSIENKSPIEKSLSNLVALRKGVITYYDLQSGERVVKIHETVEKGDLLATGIIKQGNLEKVVGAEGKVYADYWMEVSFQMHRNIQYESLVAEKLEFLQVKPAWKNLVNNPSSNSAIQMIKSVFQVKKVLIYDKKHLPVTEKWIKDSFMPMLHIKTSASLSQNGLIKQEKILHITWTNDTVKGKVLYFINDNIAGKQPIHQGD
ncbi:MAG: sporulation protein YqfD [Paenisporosarcina sp.]